jgi:hypothetical protein
MTLESGKAGRLFKEGPALSVFGQWVMGRISLVPVGAFSAKEGRGRAAEEMGGQGLAEVG